MVKSKVSKIVIINYDPLPEHPIHSGQCNVYCVIIRNTGSVLLLLCCTSCSVFPPSAQLLVPAVASDSVSKGEARLYLLNISDVIITSLLPHI